MGVLDFAGGTVVHISAGCAALAGAIVLKRRKVHIAKEEVKPASIPYVLLGTGLFGLDGLDLMQDRHLAANSLAVSLLQLPIQLQLQQVFHGYFLMSLRGRKPSALGFCIGAVVGLVAITPAAGFVGLPQSIFIGFIAAICSNHCCLLERQNYY